MGKGLMIGHQDDLAYGIGWKAEAWRSDIKEACGQYPAVYGWEIAKLGQRSMNIDSVDFGMMKTWIRQGFSMGGLITISWHIVSNAWSGR